MALLLVLWNAVSAFYPPTHHTQQCVLKLIETQVRAIAYFTKI